VTAQGNGGKLTTDPKADLIGCGGKAWFHEGAFANVMLSLKNVSQKKGLHALHDSVGDQGFTVSKPNGKDVHFPTMHPDGLHHHDFANPEVMFLQTAKDNEEGCRQCQLEQARLARNLRAKVGHPSQQVEAMVAGRMILNCPIAVADMIRADKTCGPSVASLKGKTVKSHLNKLLLI
jgi:hypothetical protein